MKQISAKIADLLIENNIIEKNDKNVFIYGIDYMLSSILHIVTTLAIGALFGMFLESVVFLISYMPIRQYAGGFHASTPTRCYFSSIIITTVVLYIIGLPIWSDIVILFFLAVASLIIFLLAPVEDKNKPLDDKEKIVYKHRTDTVLVALIAVALISFFILKPFCISVVVSEMTLSFMLILGTIKNYMIKNEHE